ncbi:recombinase family protein [Streptomyces sp. NPDC002521]
MAAERRTREVGFTSLHENLDTTAPGGRGVYHVFADLAELIRELIVQGTREGLAAARARGQVGGRPTVATEKVVRAARDLLPDSGRSITSITNLLGVSPGTPTTTSPTCANYAREPCPVSSKSPRSRRTRTRSISVALSVPQLLTPGIQGLVSHPRRRRGRPHRPHGAAGRGEAGLDGAAADVGDGGGLEAAVGHERHSKAVHN